MAAKSITIKFYLSNNTNGQNAIMFSALAKKIFTRQHKTEFYLSISEQEQPFSDQATTQAVTKKQNTEQSTLSPEQHLTKGYYDFLFGQLDETRETDELSLYIEEQVKDQLAKPEQLLETLPVLPTSLAKVLPYIKNKNFDTAELVNLLSQEPVVAAKVIELANSSYYNRSQTEVADLKSAFLMLGVQGLSEGVINGFIHQLMPQSNLYFRFYGKRIWESSLTTGEITKSLLSYSNNKDLAAEGYLLGLISNLGDIIIYQLLTDVFNFVHPDCQPNSVLFRQTLLQNSKRFSCILARHWNFPKVLTNSLALQTQLESSKQSKANLQKYPLACYLYEARLLTKLKMQLHYGLIDKEEFVYQTKRLTLSVQAECVIDKILAEHEMLEMI